MTAKIQNPKKKLVYFNRNGSHATPKVEMERRLHDRFGTDVRLIGEYRGIHGRTTFQCFRCDTIATSTFYEKLKSATGCHTCGTASHGVSQQGTHASFIERFDQLDLAADIKILGRYKKSQQGIKVQCRSCRHIWNPTPNNLLYNHTGCPECSKRTSYRSDFSSYRLGNREVRVQGYEKYALNWLLQKGADPEALSVFTEGDIPEVSYIWKRRTHFYRPDIRLGTSTLVEVKSTWTLFHWLEQNQAKAKACEAAGFTLKLLVCSPREVVCLPTAWVNWKANKIQKYLKAHLKPPQNILAMDPGSVNYGFSVVRAVDPRKPQLLINGMIRNTVKELKFGVRDQVAGFVSEVSHIMDEYGVTGVVMERYMTRGIGGTTIESVNMMIGIVQALCSRRGCSFMLLPASQWKNEFNRHSSLESFYAAASGCTPHQLDAVGIGLYGAYHWHNQAPFVGFNRHLKALATQAKETNTAKT